MPKGIGYGKDRKINTKKMLKKMVKAKPAKKDVKKK